MTAGRSVRVTRTIFAPPERVYRAWLDPGLLRRWLPPQRHLLTSVEIDERVGGHYRIRQGSREADLGLLDGELIELVPYERIVLAWRFTSLEATARPSRDSQLMVSLRAASSDATRISLVHEGLDPIEVPGMSRTLEDISREGLDGLWDRYATTGDRTLRDRLIVAYSPLVFYCKSRVAWLPPHVDESELFSNGLLELREAVERFDIDGNVEFETFALARIRTAMIDELRSLSWLPPWARTRAHEVEDVLAVLEERLQRAPNEAEIAAELGLSVPGLEEILTELANTPGFARRPPAPDPPPRLHVSLVIAILRLPVAEARALMLHFGEERSLREIGDVLGGGGSGAARLLALGMLRIRARTWATPPAPFWWVFGPAFPGTRRPAGEAWLQALNRLAAALTEPPGDDEDP